MRDGAVGVDLYNAQVTGGGVGDARRRGGRDMVKSMKTYPINSMVLGKMPSANDRQTLGIGGGRTHARHSSATTTTALR